MYQLIYKSDATVPFYSAELNRLLMKARVQNDILEITGILLMNGGSFLQVLEGEATAVEDVFSRISADPRHKALQILKREVVATRSFADWSMGFVSSYGNMLSNLSPDYSIFFDRKGSFPRGSGDLALKLLREFRYNPLRRKVDLGFSPLIVR